MNSDRGTRLAVGMGALRTTVGLVVLLIPDFGMKLFGFPERHDTPTTRLFARLFALRNILLGVSIVSAVRDRDRLRRLAMVNAALDAADAVAIAQPLVRREGIDRAAAMSAVTALAACAGFVAVAREA